MGARSNLILRQRTLKVDHPQRQRRAEQDKWRLSGEWQLHELGDSLNYACCEGKQSVGDVVVGTYWSAAYGDAAGAVVNIEFCG